MCIFFTLLNQRLPPHALKYPSDCKSKYCNDNKTGDGIIKYQIEF